MSHTQLNFPAMQLEQLRKQEHSSCRVANGFEAFARIKLLTDAFASTVSSGRHVTHPGTAAVQLAQIAATCERAAGDLKLIPWEGSRE